jgi:hypothetical protein
MELVCAFYSVQGPRVNLIVNILYIFNLQMKPYYIIGLHLWLAAATCSSWFLASGFFYPEDGGDTFLRNVGSHKIYTAPHPRRRHSSNLHTFEMLHNTRIDLQDWVTTMQVHITGLGQGKILSLVIATLDAKSRNFKRLIWINCSHTIEVASNYI